MSTVLKQDVVGAWVRSLREEQGLSLRALAARSDFSPSFISQVENGVVSPSIASMQKIASVLGVTLGEFFAASAKGAGGLIVRSSDRCQMTSGWSQARLELLGPTVGRRLETLLVTLDKGGRSAKHPSPAQSDEFAYVLEGEATLTLGPEEHVLYQGDAVSIRPRELRRWENRTSPLLRLLVVAAR